MTLKKLELSGFKSFGRKETLFFDAPVVAIVGPNGSGKSNVAEAFRWALGEQSLKSLRGKKGEDLIFNGSSSLPRLSRASVAITFDNTKRQFASIDFDEVIISREVFRDGTNEYKINGTIVRWRDIIELLAGISIGASGHHIIGQGEADRILNASPVDRRLMIEEALGLKIYQWKLSESEKKLQKTEENIRQVESVRRELVPHLKFLKKQVEKIEKVRELKSELKKLYGDYLKREEVYLEIEKERLEKALLNPRAELARIADIFNQQKGQSPYSLDIVAEENRLRDIESDLRLLRSKKDDLARSLGRLEGLLEAKVEVNKNAPAEGQIKISDFRAWLTETEDVLGQLLNLADLETIKQKVRDLQSNIKTYISRYASPASSNEVQLSSPDLDSLRQEHTHLLTELEDLSKVETGKQNIIADGKEKILALRQKAQVAERDYYELKARKQELESKIQVLLAEQSKLELAEEDFKRELGEAGVLLGREILNYREQAIDPLAISTEARSFQEERRRQIERIKIRLEDMGVESSDVLKEYDEVQAREVFLTNELNDLEKSRESLETVMSELQAKIETEFNSGLVKINQEFQKFFSLLFGGGSANLELLKPIIAKTNDILAGLGEEGPSSDDLEPKDERLGLDISVSLPRKKIKGLAMLSGGERALTSIALLFAMSQVNPPPFLILDETDAALDEANSKKYADIIENLSKYSQLILITHNRETMSRASILYGVTMGSDSVSRLISIKFDEATQYAK